MAMQNISLDDGLFSFTINNDPSRVIAFSPTDINIIDRWEKAWESIGKALKDMERASNKIDDASKTTDLIMNADAIVKEQINYIFNANVSDAAFGNVSAFALKNGEYYVERFLKAIEPIIIENLNDEAKAYNKRMDIATAKYTKPPLIVAKKDEVNDEMVIANEPLPIT